MKEKIKNFNISLIFNILKSSLFGVVTSIILVLAFAFVLNFVDLNSSVISIVSQVIKIFSILVGIIALNKISSGKLIIKGAILGVVYYLITFVVFSLLNGGVVLSNEIITDALFSALIGAIVGIIVNLISKK